MKRSAQKRRTADRKARQQLAYGRFLANLRKGANGAMAEKAPSFDVLRQTAKQKIVERFGF